MAESKDDNRLEKKFRAMFDLNPRACLIWDMQIRILDWNKAAERMFGYVKEEVMGTTLLENILQGPVDADEVVRAVYKQARESRNGFGNLNKNRRKNGEIIICDWFNSPIFDDSGEPVEIVSEAVDITERITREEAKTVLGAFIREKSGNMDTCCGDFRGVLENLAGALESTRTMISQAGGGTSGLKERFSGIDAIIRDMEDVLGTAHVNSINLRIQASRLADKHFTEAFKVIGSHFNAANEKTKELMGKLDTFYGAIRLHLTELLDKFNALLVSTAAQEERITKADEQYALLKEHMDQVHEKILEYMKL